MWKAITAKEQKNLVERRKKSLKAWAKEWLAKRWLVRTQQSVRRAHVSQHKRLRPFWRKGSMSGWLWN